MVNSRESLAKIPSMNNDANPYIITLDIYKEGYWAYDISNYYKGRVDDSGTPFMVRWFEHGQLKNVQGLRPFIRGTVGQHTVDDQTDPDNPKVVPSPDCSQIDQTGETTDTAPGGIAIYRMVNACFTQEGMFYGEIGLKDSSGLVLSSVDIAFKVLGGRMNMIGARKFYVSEFEKALDNLNEIIEKTKKDFSQELKQVIDDARNTYNSETKNAHDALLALDSQIQANRDEQENLAQHLAGTEQQIETHDVVTRPEFLNISNQLIQQVSQMKEAGLEFFDTADDLKTKYPQGANKLCVTLNDSHEWVYDYAHVQWTDAGAFNYGTIDPKLTSAIFQPNPDNLIKNSQFITTDFWNPWRDKTDPDYYIEPTSKGNAIVINGYVADGSSNESWVTTDPIEVSDSKYISVGADIALSGIDYSNGKSAMIGFDFADKKGKHSYYNRYIPAFYQDGKYHQINEMRITYPPETQTVAIAFAFYGYGTMKVRRPQASFSYLLKPYSADDLNSAIKATDNNLLIGQPLKTWDYTGFSQKATVDENMTVLDTSNAQDGDFNVIDSDFIDATALKDLIANFKGQINSSTGAAYLEIHQYSDENTELRNEDTNQLNYVSESLINTSEWHQYEFSNIVLDPAAKLIKVRISLGGKAILKIKDLSLKENTQFSKLIYQQWSKQNLAYDFLNWQQFGDPRSLVAKYTANSIELDSSDTSYNGLTSELIAIDPAQPLNISFSGESDNAFGRVEICQFDFNKKGQATNNIDICIAKSDSLQKYVANNIKLDATTRYITFRLVLYNKSMLQVSDLQVDQQDRPETQDIYENIPLQEWTANSQYSEFQNGLWNISTRNLTNAYTVVSSGLLYVKGGSTLKTTISAKVGLLPENQGRCYLEIQQFSKWWGPVNNGKNIDNYIEATDSKFEDLVFINKLNDDTNYIKVNMVVWNNADFQLRSIQGEYIKEIAPDTTNGLPQLQINALSNITSDWQTAPFSFVDKDRVVTGYLQYAVQGDSSSSYPKKNLKVKFFKDKDCKNKLEWCPKADWDKNNKFNIKANYIDATQARNLVNASLVRDAMEVTPFANNQVANKLLKTQNLGQMEGFPIELSFDDGYYGLMTFNTKKDDKPFGMDSDNKAHEAITNETPDENLNNPQDKIDGNHFATVLQKKVNPDVQANFTKFLTFINTANDTDFKAHIGDYIDLYSVINLYLFGVWSYEWDYYNKSEILLTYDSGKSYYMLAYDLDSTWRMWWDGSKLLENDIADFATANKNWIEGNGNMLISRIYKLFKPEIKAQWQKLRSTVWTNSRAVNAFKQFIRSIPEDVYERDQTKWPDIPSKSITSFAQIQQAIIERGNAMDSFMEHFADSDTTSPQPTTPTQSTTPQTGGTTPTEPQAGSTTPTGTAPAQTDSGTTSTQQTTQQAQPTEQNKDSDKQ